MSSMTTNQFLQFPTCSVEWIAATRQCITRFPDGSYAVACPHETLEYLNHAFDKANGNVDVYCWQHDIAHVIVGWNNNGPSVVLWNLAHGLPTDTPECEREELEAQSLQRALFLRATP